MTLRFSLLIVAFLALMLMVAASFAQDAGPKKSPFGIAVPPSATEQAVPGPTAAEPGVATRTWGWIMAQQAKFNREMATAVKDLKTGDPLHAIWVLASIAFLYGVFHAAGPGHGKAVISAYVLANEKTVKRGILLSLMAAFVQALSAIVIVVVLAILLNQTKLQMDQAGAWLETLSWALVAGVGAWLLVRQLKPLLLPAPAHNHHHDHAQGHHHGHAHDHAHHHHAHGEACDCGHAHIPAPKDLEGDWSWREAFALAFSVGIRPCTGAILVMIFALSQGLLWAGIFATFAMAVGTAITVSALAALAVGSRELATRMAGPESPLAARIQTTAGLLGASAVFILGSVAFIGSLTATGQSPL